MNSACCQTTNAMEDYLPRPHLQRHRRPCDQKANGCLYCCQNSRHVQKTGRACLPVRPHHHLCRRPCDQRANGNQKRSNRVLMRRVGHLFSCHRVCWGKYHGSADWVDATHHLTDDPSRRHRHLRRRDCYPQRGIEVYSTWLRLPIFN